MTTETNPQFPSAIGNEQVSYISCSLINLLWMLHTKKMLKSCWRLLLCYMICQDRNAAMLFSAWSKILDKTATLVAVTVSLKTLRWLVWHLTLIFLCAATGINKTGGKGGVFFKAVSSSTSPKLIDNGLFNFREVAVSWQSPLCCLFVCAPWTPSPGTQAVISGTYTSASKPQEILGFCAPPGWLPKSHVIACTVDVRRALTICNNPCPTPCTELFKIRGFYSLVTF